MAAEDAWPEDIPIWIDDAQKWMTGLTRRTTCDDVIYALLYARGLLDTDSTDNYAVFERWRTVERPLQGRTKIVKVWTTWGAEQPNVQLLVQRLDDYFIPTDNARARRRHRRSARQRARHCRCSIGSRTPCTRCRGNEGGGAGTGSRSKAVEQLTRHLIKQERHLQDLKRRVLDTERQIAQHEARQHARRVQRDGIDYVQDSYLIHRFPGSRSGSGSGSSDHSSTSGSAGSGSGSNQSLDSLLLAVGEENLNEYLQLCEDLHEVSQRLEQARCTQNSLAKEIEAEMRYQHHDREKPKHSFSRTHLKDTRDYHNRDVCGGASGGGARGVSLRSFSGVDDVRNEENAQREEKEEGFQEAHLEALQVQLTRAVTTNVFNHQQELDIVKEMQVWEARVRDRKRKIRQLLHQLDWCDGNEVEDDAGGAEFLGSEDSRTQQQDVGDGESAQLPGSGPSYTGGGRPQLLAFEPNVQSGETGGRTPDTECNMQSLDNRRIDNTHILGSSSKNVEYMQTHPSISAEGGGADHSAPEMAGVNCHSLVRPDTEHVPARQRRSPSQHELSSYCPGPDSAGLESTSCESMSLRQNRAMDNPSDDDVNVFTRSRTASAPTLHSSITGDRAPFPPVKARSRSKERNDRRERSKPPVPQPRSRSGTRQDSQSAAEAVFTTTSSEYSPLNGAAPPTSSDPLTRVSVGTVSSLATPTSSHDSEQRSSNSGSEQFRTFLVGRDVFSTSAPQPQGEIRPQKSHAPQQTNDSSANFPAGSRAAYPHQQLPGHRAHYSSFVEGGGPPLGLLFPPSSKDLYSSSKDDSGVASTSSDSSTDSGLLLFDDPAPLRASRHGQTDGTGTGYYANAEAAGGRGESGQSARAGAVVPPAPSPLAAELPDSFLDVSLSYGDCDDIAYSKEAESVRYGDGVVYNKSIGHSNDVKINNRSYGVGSGYEERKSSLGGVCGSAGESVGYQIHDGASYGNAGYNVSYGVRREGSVTYSKTADDAEMTDVQPPRLQPRHTWSSDSGTANHDTMHTFTVKMDTHATDPETRLDTWSEPNRVHDYKSSPNPRRDLSSSADPGLSKPNNSFSFEKSYQSNHTDTKRTQPDFSDHYYSQQSKLLADRLDRKINSVFTAGATFEPRNDPASQWSQQQHVSNEDDNRFLDTVPVIVTNGRSPSPQPVSIISTGKHSKGHVGLNGQTAASRPGKSVRFAENMTSWAWCARHDDDEDEEDDEVVDTVLSSLYGDNMLVTLV